MSTTPLTPVHEMLFLMKLAGVTGEIILRYSGGCDSGECESFDFGSCSTGAEAIFKKLRESGDIVDGLDNLLCDTIPNDYCNNEGGQGHFTLYIDTGKIEGHHEENYTETRSEESEHEAPDSLDFSIKIPKAQKRKESVLEKKLAESENVAAESAFQKKMKADQTAAASYSQPADPLLVQIEQLTKIFGKQIP